MKRNLNRKATRLEPLLTTTFINRDFVNTKEKLADVSEVTHPTSPYATAAWLAVLGLLVTWILMAW